MRASVFLLATGFVFFAAELNAENMNDGSVYEESSKYQGEASKDNINELRSKVAEKNSIIEQYKVHAYEANAHIQATQTVLAAAPLKYRKELRAKVEATTVATCADRKLSSDCKSGTDVTATVPLETELTGLGEGNCRATFVRAPYEKELTAATEASKPQPKVPTSTRRGKITKQVVKANAANTKLLNVLHSTSSKKINAVQAKKVSAKKQTTEETLKETIKEKRFATVLAESAKGTRRPRRNKGTRRRRRNKGTRRPRRNKGTRRPRRNKGTRRRRHVSAVPPVVFKPGTPFAVNAIQAPGCGLKFNPCRTTEIKTAQERHGGGHLVQVDRHGCTACPENFFPKRHYLSHGEFSGKVLCTKPRGGPLSLQCSPGTARHLVSKQKGGPLPPISCFILGYRSSNILKLGRKDTVLVGIKAICLFSKHVQCLTDTHNKRSCAVSKQVYFRAVDTCMKRVPYCKKRTKRDQCQEFDYTRCTGKTYSTKEQLAQHKDDYCVRTCEDNMPSTYGLTRAYKGGKIVHIYSADSARSAQTSDNAIPLTVAEGTEGAEQLLLSIGGSDHGPALKAGLGLLIEGPGLCATVGANM